MAYLITTILIALLSVTSSMAQTENKQKGAYKLDKPFGWAVCSSLEGGDYALSGGEYIKDGREPRRTVLRSTAGTDMGPTIVQALTDYDVIILDGSNGPFTINTTMTADSLRSKSILGTNNAILTTRFVMTPEIRQMMDTADVKHLSSSGGGKQLSNGRHVHEEAEWKVRQLLIDALGDEREDFRHSGLLKLNNCENIIVKNITFQGPGSIDVGGDDLLTVVNGTTHVWVDHCTFRDGMDGNLDIGSRSDFITVSWCRFEYGERSYMHQNTNLIGSNDNPSQGVDNLNVTYANCIWASGCNQRMPMVRFGKIHVLNCYYACPGNAAAVNARKQSELLVEGCYFEKGVRHIFSQKDALGWTLRDNHYSEPFKMVNKGDVKMPYDYTPMNASQVPIVLKSECGARNLSPVLQRLIDNMVIVEGGTFVMGATPNQLPEAESDERVPHNVTLSTYYIGKYEVTQEEWTAVMGTNPSTFKNVRRPVEGVTWFDCQKFIEKLNNMTHLQFRLPTEAEWEYAARGGSMSKNYKYSGSDNPEDVAWHNGNSGNTSHKVGEKMANELGLYDMSGNVYEWCQDWKGKYSPEDQKDPKGPDTGTKRVNRGGRWCGSIGACRVSDRSMCDPNVGFYHLGLRLVLDNK